MGDSQDYPFWWFARTTHRPQAFSSVELRADKLKVQKRKEEQRPKVSRKPVLNSLLSRAMQNMLTSSTNRTVTCMKCYPQGKLTWPELRVFVGGRSYRQLLPNTRSLDFQNESRYSPLASVYTSILGKWAI